MKKALVIVLAVTSLVTVFQATTAEARRRSSGYTAYAPPPPPCMYGNDANGYCALAPAGTEPGCHVAAGSLFYDSSISRRIDLNESECSALRTSDQTAVSVTNPSNPYIPDARNQAYVDLITPIVYGSFGGKISGSYSGNTANAATQVLTVIDALTATSSGGFANQDRIIVKGTWVSGTVTPTYYAAPAPTPAPTPSPEPIVSEPVYTFDWSSWGGFYW